MAILLAFEGSSQDYAPAEGATACQIDIRAARAAVKEGAFIRTPLVDAATAGREAAALIDLKKQIFTCSRQNGPAQSAPSPCGKECERAFNELVEIISSQRTKLAEARDALSTKLGESADPAAFGKAQANIQALAAIIKEFEYALQAPGAPEPPPPTRAQTTPCKIDTTDAVQAAEAGAFIVTPLVDASTAALEAEALANLKKQIFQCTRRDAGCLPSEESAKSDTKLEGCGPECVNAYTRLVDVINSQRTKLAETRSEMMSKLGDSEDAKAFATAQEKISALGATIKKFDLALQAQGSPECDCKTARTISKDWLIRSATQKDSAQIIACVRQMRQALLEADKPECENESGVRDCDRHLARLEGILFENGRRDQERLAANTKDYADLKFPADQTAMNELLAEQKEIKQRLAETKRLLVLPDDKPLFQAFEDYDRYVSKLSAGVEYTSLGNVFATGLPRLGYTARIRYGGRGVPELRPEAGKSHRFGLEHTFSAFLTNSGAQSLIAGTPATGTTLPTGTNDDEVVPALRIETTVFWPLLRTARLNQRLRSYAGPILLVGAQIADIDEPPPDDDPTTVETVEPQRADSRLYGGFRAALSPEIFADFMVGKNRSLHEWRAEVRGQVPVLRISERSRISLGASGNFALERPPIIKGSTIDARYPDHDSVTVFLSWDADFKLAKAP
jgi:hypothetical protein